MDGNERRSSDLCDGQVLLFWRLHLLTSCLPVYFLEFVVLVLSGLLSNPH